MMKDIKDTANYRLNLTEDEILKELTKMDSIIDDIEEIESIKNIKNKLRKIEEGNNNIIIRNRVEVITLKVEKIEENFRYYNGRRYATIKEVQIIKDEIYYIENEAYKFDLLGVNGMQLFLELMSLRRFESMEAKDILDKYKSQFIEMRGFEEQKIERQEGKVASEKNKNKLITIIWSPAITFGLLMLTVMLNIFIGLWKFTAVAGIIFGLSIPVSIGAGIYYLAMKSRRTT